MLLVLLCVSISAFASLSSKVMLWISICLGKFKNQNQRESLFKGEGAKDIFPGKIWNLREELGPQKTP